MEGLKMSEEFENEDGKIILPLSSNARLACALLLDVSGSMRGQAIKCLNETIHRFKEELLMDSVVRQTVDISIITFASTVEVISGFTSIVKMPTPTLEAYGDTEMAKGIQKAIDMVKERTKFYSTCGIRHHKPWIFMITDGAATSSPQEMEDAATRIHMEEEKGSHGHLSFWALAVDNYDPDQLFSLTHRVMELKDQHFTTIFDWDGMSTMIQSNEDEDERVDFNPLPTNARKAEKDRAIGDDWS